jgi:uncharacterized protein
VNPVFADTSFFVALIDDDDSFHVAARKFLLNNRYPIITSSAVILELGAFFSQSSLRWGFIASVASIDKAKVQVIHVDPDLQRLGINLFEARPDKDWSLTDCISFAVMEQCGCHDAATSDKHFEEAGFVALLRELPKQ